ncbi:hypothetical protein GCM10023085_51050 [Actinomadura viridis]|uniref:Uncharacterized protein n=1 Tax=Actinomadura viridis TaxID=58110 RepID=A0A931GR07_9ACTN|nr:hypothetical protein [Actinomadura viridis]MBG6092316.1 hypothetical protein [Actinomadura viridis]
MPTHDLQAVVDELLVLPFPPDGPDCHVRVLQASQDFWEDRSEEIVAAAEEEIDTACQALVTSFTARWGGPETIDLDPYLWSEAPAPEPMNTLAQLSGEMLLWRRPGAGRWVALTVGQADPEFPIELRAAVGAAPIPEPPMPGMAP